MAFVLVPSLLLPSRPSSVPLTSPQRRLPSHHRRPALPIRYSPIHPPVRSINAMTMSCQEGRDKSSLVKTLRAPLVVILLHLSTASIFMSLSEGWAFLDALYFSVVVATTIGYGDLVPLKPASKIFVSLYAILSVALIAGMLQALVERIADAHRQIRLRTAHTILKSTSIASNGGMLETAREALFYARRTFFVTVVTLGVAILSGALLYARFLGVGCIDLIYFICVSMTTVGLGDIHPVSRLGKGYAVVWLLFTSLAFANILSQYAELKLKERELTLAKQLLESNIGEEMFIEIDVDHDGTLSEAEFLGYMICKLGKASPEEIQSILQRFQDIDADNSGYITKQEVISSWKKNC